MRSLSAQQANQVSTELSLTHQCGACQRPAPQAFRFHLVPSQMSQHSLKQIFVGCQLVVLKYDPSSLSRSHSGAK